MLFKDLYISWKQRRWAEQIRKKFSMQATIKEVKKLVIFEEASFWIANRKLTILELIEVANEVIFLCKEVDRL